MKNKNYIIPIFVPHRGCPNDCVFCNQKKITGLSTDVTAEDVENTILEWLITIPSKKNIEVAFYGGSFTAIDYNIQESLLKVVLKFKEKGLVDRIRLSTRPDCIDIKNLELLKKYSVDIIELGVQSLDEEVLLKSARGHSSHSVKDAVQAIKSYGFSIGLQMMIGLPGDSKEKSIETGKKIIELEPDFVRIYPTLVVKDTFLEKMLIDQIYTPLTLEEAIDICTYLVMMFNYYGIPIIRVGLQPTENIQLNQDVIAGPFHPAFRQLVESNIYRLILDEFFLNIKLKEPIFTIRIKENEISSIVGQKSSNLKYLLEKFNLKKISILKDRLPKGELYIQNSHSEFKIIKREYEEGLLKKYGII